MSDASFNAWIDDLRAEAARFYRAFDVVPEHWRDQYEKGITAADAFRRVLDAIFEPTAEELAAFERRKGATLQ